MKPTFYRLQILGTTQVQGVAQKVRKDTLFSTPDSQSECPSWERQERSDFTYQADVRSLSWSWVGTMSVLCVSLSPGWFSQACRLLLSSLQGNWLEEEKQLT